MKYMKRIFAVILTGVAAGGVSTLYRLTIMKGDKLFYALAQKASSHVLSALIYVGFLVLMAVIMMVMLKIEPRSGGSGIPQIKAELSGHQDSSWYKVIIAKVIGGTAAMAAGFSVGRAGPSIHLGGMAGKGVGECLKIDQETRKTLIKCGCTAGLAATFNAPLAGVFFVMEEMHHTVRKRTMISLLMTALIANGISRFVFGYGPVFAVSSELATMPFYYVIVLGILCGLLGGLYTKSSLIFGSLYAKIPLLKPYQRVILPVVLSGVIGLIFPLVNTGGASIVSYLSAGTTTLMMLLLLLVAKWLFTVFCTSSGAASGAFFPVLTIGALIGAIMGAMFKMTGMDASYMSLCMILGAGAFFTAVMHTPLTSIVMMLEVTGSLMLGSSVILVCLTAYIVACVLPVASLNQELYRRMIQ